MFFKIILQCFLINLTYSISQHPILIVVSYDAFKYNYFDTKMVPNMSRLKKVGTYADYLINVFPTKTFPNHYSIATGLYPESHGVIGNNYFDSKSNKIIGISYEMFHFNNEVVPIWRLNEDMGECRYSGVMMWPGGVYPYQGKNVTYSHDYDPNFDWYKRIDTVIKWIKDPDKPANLIMLYFEEPDTHSHIFGTNSEIVNTLIQKLDNITLYLEQQLKANQLTDKVNVIHLSDHGMLNVKSANLINVTQYLTTDTYTYAGSSPILQFIPKPKYEAEIYENLKNASIRNGHFKVYKKSEYLKRWHYKNNPRSPSILVMAEPGYALDDLIVASEKYAEKFHLNITEESEFGVHGYDYEQKDMRPFFMARGPKIKTQHKVAPFKTVDLYNLFCEILEITPDKNNGTLANIKDVLIPKRNGKYSLTSILVITAAGIFIALILISCAAMITLLMIKRQQSIITTAALNKRFPQTFQTSVEAQHLLESEEA